MRKIICWTDRENPGQTGNFFVHVHVIGGLGVTAMDYQNLVNELRKTFPTAGETQVEFGKYRRSSLPSDKLAIIAYNSYIPKGEYLGWEQQEGEILPDIT